LSCSSALKAYERLRELVAMQILAIRQAMRFNVLELAPKPLEIQVLLMLGLTQIKALQKVMKVVGRWVNEEVER
jgi:hypothetical protein